MNTGQPNTGQPSIDTNSIFSGSINDPQSNIADLSKQPAPITPEPVVVTTPTNEPAPNPIPNDSILNSLIGDTITDDNKSIRDEILTTFKGANITKDGIVNNTGEVIVSQEDLTKYLDTGELPNNPDTNNTTPNAIDEQGLDDSLVLKTKSQLEEYFGLELEGDYDDTDEGLIGLTTKAVELAEDRAINMFLSNNPIINDFVNHLRAGGDPNEFNADLIDYNSINTEELSLDTKLNFIKNKLKSQGVDDADSIIGLYKTAGEEKILEETRKAIDYLRQKQDNDSKLRELEVQKQVQEEKEQIKKYWEDVKGTVTKGKISNITIPINDRQKFFDYLSKPVAGNKSQEMIDAEKEPIDFDLMVSYLRYKKGDISKLTTVMAAENKALTLRERMNKHNTSMRGNSPISNQGNPNAGIDLNKIF